MKILVTGGAGFMGSNFIRHILKKYPNYQIVNLDKLTYAGNLDNLIAVQDNPNYKFVKGDITDSDLVRLAAEGVNAIVNFAAETHVDRSIHNPREFAVTDVVGTLSLLGVARDLKIDRFVQISTDEVFGSVNTPANESAPFLPNSPYAASKAGAELLCRAFGVTYKVPIIISHCLNNYGPFHHPEKLIPLFITRLLEDKKVPVYGDGTQVRGWVYVDDHSEAIDLILHKGTVGESYNIDTGEYRTNLEVTYALLSLLGKDESFIQHVEDRKGHDERYWLDGSKLSTQLGWKPQVTFEEGLAATVQWYKENEQWWRKIKNSDFEEFYSLNYASKS